MKIQLAIQGGGAKLVTLLGAASAIQELQEKQGPLLQPRIQLTRIVGTSAGAIVGALLAAGVDLKAFRNELKAGIGAKLSASLKEPRRGHWCKTALTGAAIWNTSVLREVLGNIFEARGERLKKPLVMLSDLKKATGVELRVIVTDLRSPHPVVYKPEGNDKELVTALLDSAGIPIFFRTWRDGGLVDGGLVQNFPWEELIDDQPKADQSKEAYGPIVGLSFASESRDIPNTRSGYAKSLLIAAMDSATERARSRLGTDRVLTLPSDYNTFDFGGGFSNEALTNHFDLIQYKTKEWFEVFLRSSGVAIESDPWSGGNLSMMEKLGKMYELQHRNTLLKYHDFRLEVSGFGLLGNSEPDVINYTFTFSTTNAGVYCHTVALSQATKDSGFFKKSEIILTDSSGNVIAADYLPIFDPKTPEKREVLLFFDRVLPPGSGPYTLRIRDTVKGLTADLFKDRKDVLTGRTQRTLEPIDKALLIMHLPESFVGARMVESPDRSDSQTPGRPMTRAELLDFDPPAPRWITLGWVGEAVQPGEPFGPSVLL